MPTLTTSVSAPSACVSAMRLTRKAPTSASQTVLETATSYGRHDPPNEG